MRTSAAPRCPGRAARCCGRRLSVVASAGANVSRRDVLGAAVLAAPLVLLPGRSVAGPSSIYDFSAAQYDKQRSLADYKGQTLNYPGLRALWDKYHEQGLNLVAFPCNQFGGQAPGTSQEEREWAWKKFGLEFDVFDKLEVNGPGAHPLYKFLKDVQPAAGPGAPTRPNGDVAWNYEKFLVNRSGVPVKRYKPSFDPLNMEDDVRLVLGGKGPLPGECFLHPGRKACKVDALLAA